MSCTYTYGSQEASSVEELLTLNPVINDIQQATKEALRFYHSGNPKQQAIDTLKLLVQKHKNYTGNSQSVTNIVKNNFPFPPSTFISQAIEKKRILQQKFYTKYGTLIHNCIASVYPGINNDISSDVGNFEDNIDKLLQLLTSTKEEYEQQLAAQTPDTFRWDDAPFNSLPQSKEELMETFKNLYNSIGLSRYVVGQNLFFEVPVLFDEGGHTYKGVIDCVMVDDDGKVTILDFKSTSQLFTGNIKDTTQQQYLLQLKMYEQMLIHSGIAEDKVVSYITPITTYQNSLQKLEVNGETFIGKQGTKVSKKYNKRQQMYVEVMTLLYDLFPRQKTIIPAPEIENRKNNIRKGLRTLFTANHLNRDTPEMYQEYLSNRYLNKKKPYRIASDLTKETFVYLEMQGEDVLLKKGNTVLKSLPLKEFVEKELEAQTKNRSTIFESIRKAFIKKNENALTELLGRERTVGGEKVEHLKKYLGNEWKLLNDGDPTLFSASSIVDDNFLFLFRNITTGEIDIISLVPNVNIQFTYTLDTTDGKQARRILSNVVDKKTLDTFLATKLESSITNINCTKACAVYSAIQDLLPSNSKLGQIMCLSQVNGDAQSRASANVFIDQLKIIQVAKKQGKTISDDLTPLIENVQDIQTVARRESYFSQIANAINLAKSREKLNERQAQSFLSALSDNTASEHEIIEKLKNLQIDLRESFAEEFAEDRVSRRAETTDVQYIDDVLSEAIIFLQEGTTFETLSEVSTTGLDFNNSLRLGWQILTNNLQEFTASGVSICGLFQGIDTAAPYSNPSEIVRYLSQWHSQCTTRIQQELDDYVDGQNRAYAIWIKHKKTIAPKIFGSGATIFRDTFVKRDGDKYDKDYKLKDPFDESETLDSYDREYLKYCIWDLIRIKKYIDSPTLNQENVKKLNWTELQKNESYLNAFKTFLQEHPAAFNIPLRVASDGVQASKMFEHVLKGDFKEAKAYAKSLMGVFSSISDDRGITPAQEKQKKDSMKRLEAFNMYNENEETREKRLEKRPIESFEANLNYLVIDHAYSYVTQVINQQILDNTDRLMSVLTTIEKRTGQDLSKHRDAILSRTNISIYNTNNVDDDYKDLAVTLNVLRKVLNLTAIAFRPTLMAKELIVGRLKNIMHASLDYLKTEDITLKHMLQAEKIVFGEGVIQEKLNKLSSKVDADHREKVAKLNDLFRIANRDANVMSQKASASKTDFLGVDTDLSFYTNTRPDWYNRMSILVAKMLADGSWDAYSVVDNKLVYDCTKDARYSIYFKYKDNPPKKGNPLFDQYMKQEALYAWSLRQFQKESIYNLEGKYLKNGDKLPRAYTGKEINSIKEAIGLLYGYFNHEELSIWQTETYAKLFVAFKTFWNAEWRYSFGLPNMNTSRGKLDYIRDVEGNVIYEQIDDATGIRFTTTEESHVNSKGEIIYHTALMDFQGIPTEGIAISFMKCLRDVFTEEGRQHLRDTPEQYKQAIIFLLRLLYWSFVASLSAFFITGSERDNYAVVKTLQTFQKSANDLNMFKSLDISDLNLVGVENLKSLAFGTFESITDADGYNPERLFRNIGAVRDIMPDNI